MYQINKTFMAKYNSVLPRTHKVRPKSEIYTPKWEEHPCPFHSFICESPPLPLGKILEAYQ